MKKNVVTTLLAIGVAALFLYAKFGGSDVLSNLSTAQSVMAATPVQPSATLTPSPVPSPTLDIVMTAQVLSNDALRKLAEAKVVEANSLGTQQSAVSTVQAANLAVLQLTATLAEQDRQVAIINVTIQAGNVKQAEANSAYIRSKTEQMQAYAAMTAEVPLHQAVQDKALLEVKRTSDYNEWLNILQIVIIPLIVAFVLFIAFLAYRVAGTKIWKMIEEGNAIKAHYAVTPNEAMEVTQPVVVQHTQPGNFMAATQYELPAMITREKMVSLADEIINHGKAFSRAVIMSTGITKREYLFLRGWGKDPELNYWHPITGSADNIPWFVTLDGEKFLRTLAPASPLTREDFKPI